MEDHSCDGIAKIVSLAFSQNFSHQLSVFVLDGAGIHQLSEFHAGPSIDRCCRCIELDVSLFDERFLGQVALKFLFHRFDACQ